MIAGNHLPEDGFIFCTLTSLDLGLLELFWNVIKVKKFIVLYLLEQTDKGGLNYFGKLIEPYRVQP